MQSPHPVPPRSACRNLADSTTHIPASRKWEFDEQVASVFEDMLKRSIPGYDEMRDLVGGIALRYCGKNGGSILDLGCSHGEQLARLSKIMPRAQCDGIEISEPMLLRARDRHMENPQVSIRTHDLREGFPRYHHKRNVVLSILTLQFVPIEYRQELVSGALNSLVEGGAFIFVEKVLGSSASMQDLLVCEYIAKKLRSGYGNEQVEAKRRALEGVLVPVTAAWNEDMLRNAGFRHVECFWRNLNFAGWVAVR